MNNAIQRFWSQVEKTDGCFLWTGTLTEKGYGAFTAKIDGHQFWRAHRFSWFIHNGPILWDQHVLHNCDNPACVNPEHLWLGTNADNMADKIAKGRHKPGAAHGRARLTDEDIYEIRTSPLTHSEIGRVYGIDCSHVGRIRSGVRWSHLPVPDEQPWRQHYDT